MGNTQKTGSSGQASPWVFGFDLSDFEIPSKKTEIAEIAKAVTDVVMEFASADTASHEAMLSEEKSTPTQTAFMQVLAGWGETDVDQDYADRKVRWPAIDSLDYAPRADAQSRIEDNISAIKLLREIQDSKRTVTDEDRKVLLRYCGWGGLARVFSPDGTTPHQWAHYRDELEALVGERAYADMRASINTAFFTDPAVVNALWSIARHLGFKGGRVVEPSAGVGHFLAGMPADMASRSEITAVEMDPTSAGMLEASFGPLGVQVHASPLEKAKLPAAFYDLVIGNVPFGDYKSLDGGTASYAQWSIHNYFLGKSVDLVRPGGLIILITSRHTMDSEKDAHRKWLAAHAELLGAFRLPTMAFKGQANTEAVTDIMVFKRRETPDYTAAGWTGIGVADETALKPGQPTMVWNRTYARNVQRVPKINSYYVGHPKQVIGLMEWESTQYGESLNPVFSGDSDELEQAILGRIESLPTNVFKLEDRSEVAPMASAMQRYRNDSFVSPGSFVCKNGRICVSEGDELLDLDSIYTGTARKRLLGMIEVRQIALRVIEFQASSMDDVELASLQGELNRIYDNFVSEFGYLSTSANSRIMRGDPDWPVMLALEIWDEEEGKAAKADIFTKRTVGHREIPEQVDNVKDAMLLSLALYGQIVLKDMSLRTGSPVMQVVKELKAQALAYRDPVAAKWVPADEYLSGHIRDKIAAAKAAGPAYQENIPALEAVLPKDLGPMDVEARLGAPWIPTDVIKTFATELVNDDKDAISVSFDVGTASWSVKATSWRIEWVGDRALQVGKWGTDKRCALVLLESALNQQPPTVTRTIDGKQVTDTMETIKAREKWQCIRDKFRAWVYQDGDRTEKLLRIYNDMFNQIVERKFDGSHLTLPGMSTVVVPYGHQKDAIWRIVTSGNTLLAHCVGAGKTLVMCAASMELRRLGKASKPVHVVQNNCLEQYAAEFVRLYPQARVLIASKNDLQGDKRRTFVARVATGSWDAVLMTQSTFERVPLSPDLQTAFIDKMSAEARSAISLAEDRGAKRSLKEIEKRLKDYQAKIERLLADKKKDNDGVWFNELGVDYALIDEAHAYKNLGRISKMPRMAGLSNTASQRAFDVFMKTRYLMGLHGDQEDGVVMATATPISNSLAEFHTMQVYLQPNTLKKFGIYEFDSWSASYGESVTGIELSPDGGGYRMNTRYCRFVNLPELMAIFKQVADVKTKRMLNLPTPRIEGGKPQTKVAKPSEELLAIVGELVARADKIRGGGVEPAKDNMLKVTNDGRKAALDVRLVDPTLPCDPTGKLAIAAQEIYEIWKRGEAKRTTQLVFSDLGTPGGEGFNVYDEVKRLLIAHGVPDKEIEFAHDHNTDAAKAKLFKRVREGAVRVLVGSTQLMGTGTNVQRLLAAIHQLDSPWRPSDVEQRDGRGDRQGNLNESIALLRYVTERSFDAYSWNLLDVKAKFIEQVMTADSGLRSVEDISMSALTYSEIKAIASGNPLVMEKATVDARIQTISLKRSQFEDDRWRYGRREADLVSRLRWIDSKMPELEQAAKLANDVSPVTPFVAATELSEKAVVAVGHGRETIGAAFRAHSNAGVLGNKGVLIGSIGGFDLEATKLWDAKLYVMDRASGYEIEVERPNMNDLVGTGVAVFKAIEDFKQAPARLREEYGSKSNELATVRGLLEQEFEGAEELDQLLLRQREIEKELDLDKDTAGTQSLESESA